jgi:hypothetical protein
MADEKEREVQAWLRKADDDLRSHRSTWPLILL